MSSIIIDKAHWSAPKNINAFTTTVHGGVSDGVYASMNLGDHVGDDQELVLKNRALIKAKYSLPSEPIWLKQVHGTEVLELTGGFQTQTADGSQTPIADSSQITTADGSQITTADGSFTKVAGVVCAIMTADCMPLFLTNRSGDRVALLHAGWRGLADGIIESGVRALECPVNEVIAWAGPCIGPEAFEIGDEVRQQLGEVDGAYHVSPNSSPSQVKWLANLYKLAGQRLVNLGVNDFSHSLSCTFSDERYFSYRRTGQCGRMASYIWMDATQ